MYYDDTFPHDDDLLTDEYFGRPILDDELAGDSLYADPFGYEDLDEDFAPLEDDEYYDEEDAYYDEDEDYDDFYGDDLEDY